MTQTSSAGADERKLLLFPGKDIAELGSRKLKRSYTRLYKKLSGEPSRPSTKQINQHAFPTLFHRRRPPRPQVRISHPLV